MMNDYEIRARLSLTLGEVRAVRADLKPEPADAYEAHAHQSLGEVDVKLDWLVSDLSAGNWAGRPIAGYPPGEEK